MNKQVSIVAQSINLVSAFSVPCEARQSEYVKNVPFLVIEYA